jgi:hypothetical protein
MVFFRLKKLVYGDTSVQWPFEIRLQFSDHRVSLLLLFFVMIKITERYCDPALATCRFFVVGLCMMRKCVPDRQYDKTAAIEANLHNFCMAGVPLHTSRYVGLFFSPPA